MKRKQQNHTIDILFVITLFCVFAVSVVMLTGTGAKVYQRIVNDMSENHNSRTACSYVFNKIHQADKNGAVSLGDYAGMNSVLMLEEIDNINYCTYLYCYDGNLCEIFARYDYPIEPQYGTVIMPIKDLTAENVTGSLYKFTLTTQEGEVSTIYVHARTTRVNDQ